MTAAVDAVPAEPWLAVAGLACILGPLAAMVWWRHRSGAPYRAFAYGAAVFFVFQVVLRLPWQVPLAHWARAHPGWQTEFLLFSALTAGLFEEAGRYAGYRVGKRVQWTRDAAVMYGLGHGGCEAILLIGLNLLGSAIALHLASRGLIGSPALAATLDALARGYDGQAALATVVERAFAIVLHVGLALVVLQALVRRQLRWVALAIAIHACVDFVAVFTLHTLHWPVRDVEATIGAIAIAVLLAALRLARADRPPPAAQA
jgi:uncharacterized membrane protein YhfC